MPCSRSAPRAPPSRTTKKRSRTTRSTSTSAATVPPHRAPPARRVPVPVVLPRPPAVTCSPTRSASSATTAPELTAPSRHPRRRLASGTVGSLAVAGCRLCRRPQLSAVRFRSPRSWSASPPWSGLAQRVARPALLGSCWASGVTASCSKAALLRRGRAGAVHRRDGRVLAWPARRALFAARGVSSPFLTAGMGCLPRRSVGAAPSAASRGPTSVSRCTTSRVAGPRELRRRAPRELRLRRAFAEFARRRGSWA